MQVETVLPMSPAHPSSVGATDCDSPKLVTVPIRWRLRVPLQIYVKATLTGRRGRFQGTISLEVDPSTPVAAVLAQLKERAGCVKWVGQ
jgi:hypothetical protein